MGIMTTTTTTSLTNLLNFDLPGLIAYCQELGEKPFRATQLFRWIHQRGATDFAQMTDLAKSLREKLTAQARIEGLKILTQQESRDGTIKWLFDVGEAMRLRRCSSPRTIAARCAFLPRPGARWAAVFAPQGTRALAAT